MGVKGGESRVTSAGCCRDVQGDAERNVLGFGHVGLVRDSNKAVGMKS